MAPVDPATVVRLAELVDVPAPPDPGTLRRWGAIGLVLALALTAGLVRDPAVTGDAILLGRSDDATGRSSLLPPVDDLQLLWQRRVDVLPSTPTGPPRLLDLGDHVVIGETVLDTTGGAAPGHLPADAVPSADGRVVIADGDEVLVVDVRTGRVTQRHAVAAAGDWHPVGSSLGWVAGAAVLVDEAGVLGLVESDGDVRWVGDPTWSWAPAGNDSDWAVVVAAGEPSYRVLVVDGRDGRVQRDVGPVGVVHAPVVHGDTFAWVDPYGGLDRGVGRPVEVHGVRLDGTGRVWAVRDLPPTKGVPQAVRLAAVGAAGLVVHYWTAGDATTAVWLDPVDGSRRGQVAVSGTGETGEGWPVAWVDGDVIAHIDPVRREVRAVDSGVVDGGAVVRWTAPASSSEGVVLDGDVVLLRTPPRGTLLQSRLQLHDALTGALLWDRVTDDTQHQRLVSVVGDDIGVTAGPVPGPLRSHAWFNLDTGRRRAHSGVATQLLDDGPDPQGRIMLGRADGSERVDDDQRIVVGAATVTASDVSTGSRQWRRTTPVALRVEGTLLLDELVVVLGWDGVVRALDRRDGSQRWTGPSGVTAMTAGGDEVVLGLATGEVVVLAPDGAQLQRIRAGHAAVEDVAVVGGRVVATVGGDLVAFGHGTAFVEPVDRVQLP